MARHRQNKEYAQDYRTPNARLRSASPPPPRPSAYWAAAACNQSERQVSARSRRLMFSLAPAEWHAVWHVIRRREADIKRGIGLEFMKRLRKFRGWPRPTANVRMSLPWTPKSDIKSCTRIEMRSMNMELHNMGIPILLPALKKLRIGVTQALGAALPKPVRNAPAFYKLLGSNVPCECACASHPNLQVPVARRHATRVRTTRHQAATAEPSVLEEHPCAHSGDAPHPTTQGLMRGGSGPNY